MRFYIVLITELSIKRAGSSARSERQSYMARSDISQNWFRITVGPEFKSPPAHF